MPSDSDSWTWQFTEINSNMPIWQNQGEEALFSSEKNTRFFFLLTRHLNKSLRLLLLIKSSYSQFPLNRTELCWNLFGKAVFYCIPVLRKIFEVIYFLNKENLSHINCIKHFSYLFHDKYFKIFPHKIIPKSFTNR